MCNSGSWWEGLRRRCDSIPDGIDDVFFSSIDESIAKEFPHARMKHGPLSPDEAPFLFLYTGQAGGEMFFRGARLKGDQKIPGVEQNGRT